MYADLCEVEIYRCEAKEKLEKEKYQTFEVQENIFSLSNAKTLGLIATEKKN